MCVRSVPMGRLSHREPSQHLEYVMARHNGRQGADCSSVYYNCPVSLLSVATSLVPATL